MATNKNDKMPDQDQFLAGLDAKIAALHALRSSYVTAVSLGAFGFSGDASMLGSLGATMPKGIGAGDFL